MKILIFVKLIYEPDIFIELCSFSHRVWWIRPLQKVVQRNIFGTKVTFTYFCSIFRNPKSDFLSGTIFSTFFSFFIQCTQLTKDFITHRQILVFASLFHRASQREPLEFYCNNQILTISQSAHTLLSNYFNVLYLNGGLKTGQVFKRWFE